jgi:hypothetical protein
MVLGRIVHYAFDAILLSTVVAGVRRSSGFTSEMTLLLSRSVELISFNSPDAATISDPTIRSITERFLGVGESIFDMVQATAVNSSYFKRESRK